MVGYKPDMSSFVPKYKFSGLGIYNILEPSLSKKEMKKWTKVDHYIRNNSLYWSEKCNLPKVPTHGRYNVVIKLVLYALFDMSDKYTFKHGFYYKAIENQINSKKREYIHRCYLKSLAVSEYITRRAEFRAIYKEVKDWDKCVKGNHSNIRLKYHKNFISNPKFLTKQVIERAIFETIPYFVYCEAILKRTKYSDKSVERHYKLNSSGKELKRLFQKEKILL